MSYTWFSDRWVLPAVYYKTTVVYKAMGHLPSGMDPGHPVNSTALLRLLLLLRWLDGYYVLMITVMIVLSSSFTARSRALSYQVFFSSFL